jgi:hypothetical protein
MKASAMRGSKTIHTGKKVHSLLIFIKTSGRGFLTIKLQSAYLRRKCKLGSFLECTDAPIRRAYSRKHECYPATVRLKQDSPAHYRGLEQLTACALAPAPKVPPGLACQMPPGEQLQTAELFQSIRSKGYFARFWLQSKPSNLDYFGLRLSKETLKA